MSSKVQRTYSRRNRSTLSSSSPPPEDPAPEPSTSSPSSTPPSSPIPKRSLSDALVFGPLAKKPRLPQPSANKPKYSSATSPKWRPQSKKRSLIQLHFSIDASILRTCPICDLSYTKGAQDDEALHKSHCARIQRGLEWTKDEIKESIKHGVVEIESGIRLKDGSIGRILAVNANVPGKIGSKVPFPLSPEYNFLMPSVRFSLRQKHKNNQLVALFETINLTLSSPPLSRKTLAESKAFLFLLTPSTSSTGTKTKHFSVRPREKIVGCVIAQPIATAMRVIQCVGHTVAKALPEAKTGETESNSVENPVNQNNSPSRSETAHTPLKEDLITVDASTSLYCSPELLPTPLGIPRMFVSSSFRRLGIASRLLTAAANNFIHGVTLNPVKGEVAFTQPTTSGKAVMEKWGKKGARIYRETENQ